MALQYDQPAQDVVQLLPERPLNEDELQRLDGQRLKPVITSLCGQLEGYLAQNHRHQRQPGYTDAIAEPQPLLVGLFGPFGQGKSTVLNAIKQKLMAKQVVPWQFADRRPPRIVTLDVSHLKPEGIENFFWTLLLRHSFNFWAWVVAVIWGPLLMSVMYPDNRISQCLTDKVFGLPAMLALLLPALEGVVKGIGQWVNIDPSLIDRTVHRIGRWLSFWPDVLLIDDLDRARVDQQRSLLWALYRRAHRMQCAVVVAFDESELLASEPAPESPEELLRKLLLVTYRLPLRTAEDAAGFALSLCQEWADTHRDHPLASVVPDVTSVAALTQLAIRLGQISPRRIKSLLQDTLLQAQSLHHAVTCVGVDTWMALLFLTALRQEVPVRCRDTAELVAVLERPTTEAIAAWLRPMGDKHSKCELLRRLLPASALFAAERHSWRALVAGLLTDSLGAVAAVPSESGRSFRARDLSPDDLDILGRWWCELDSVAREHGHEESNWPNRMLKGPIPVPDEDLPAQREHALRLGWLAMWAYWPTAVRPAARLRVAEWWQVQVLKILMPGEPSQRLWRRDLWRLLLTDAELLALVPDTALRDWVKQAEQDDALWVFVAALPAAPKNAHAVYWRLVARAGLPEEGRVRRALGGRLPSKLPAAAEEEAGGTNADANFTVLRGTWPLVVADRQGVALSHHVSTTVAQYARYVPAHKRVHLMSLRAFMDSVRADEIAASEWLTLLAPLVQPDSGEGWAPDRWTQGELPRPLRNLDQWKNFIPALDHGQWVAGLALLLTDAASSTTAPAWHEALVALWQLGEERGWRLGSEWLGNRRLLDSLARRVNDGMDSVHLRAWLACQWLSQPDEDEFDRLEIRSRLRQWLSSGKAEHLAGALPAEFWVAWPHAMHWLFEHSDADALNWLPVPPGAGEHWPEAALDDWVALLVRLHDQARGKRQTQPAIECGEQVLQALRVSRRETGEKEKVLGAVLAAWRKKLDDPSGQDDEKDEFRD